ncbi:putative E3 ubiquitin-protein ligase HERC4 [Echinococcus granulosus]|uniref:E3 ubiquitin-protein ligase HERC4 n=1 Tax=Echinococcus granulosus TaxID=6210 RepID=W6V8P2_ECHGR|nr:putative E3 ubiquitin-protein ligase HERC4 [Echinococcus granulosus]EUB62914.1 putative E3 ubiquitin-protein ligase HERC4 [Echinococcus granulosus]
MSTILYGWGSSDDGQLGPVSGVEPCAQVNRPTVVNWPPMGVSKHLVKLACGYQHTLALDSEGLVYSSGSNEFGQLGHCRRPNAFDKVSGIKEQIRDIAAGPYHSAAITTAGRVYMWGCNTNHQLGREDFDDTGVRPLDFNYGPIVQISLGLEHTIALTEASEIYTWGSNNQGQLGLGYCSSRPMVTPQLVECLSALPVRQVAAGANHNLLVTPSGSVYAWGSNSRGQLGLDEPEIKAQDSRKHSRTEVSANETVSRPGVVSVPTPRLLKSMKRRGVTFVACGETHSALLTKDGAVFTFGDGRFGQLGHGSSAVTTSQPQQVFELMGDTCTQVWCGRRHTLVLVTNPSKSPPQPRLLVFGCGVDGQLGLLNRERTFVPIVVKGPWLSHESSPSSSGNSDDLAIIGVYTGGNHCFAVTHHSGLACPTPIDFRKWRSCLLSNIGTFSEPLMRRYVEGLAEHPYLMRRRSSRKFSSTDATAADISDATYSLEAYSMHTALRRLESAFGSIGCLASSLLVDNPNRSHYNIGRADHGMDLDAAHELQEELFLAAPPNAARRLIRPLVEVISRPRRNFPDLECLRAFVFLAVSPLLETPRTDAVIVTVDTSVPPPPVTFQNDEPFNWYPTVLAGYAAGFVLASFCRAVCRLEGVPSSVLDSWFKGFQPRFFRRLVANLNNFVAYLCSSKQDAGETACFNLISGIHATLELMKRLREINEKRVQPISYTSFYVPELTDRFDVKKFANWLVQRHSREKAINSYSGQSPPPRATPQGLRGLSVIFCDPNTSQSCRFPYAALSHKYNTRFNLDISSVPSPSLPHPSSRANALLEAQRRFRFWRSKSVPPKPLQNQDFSIFDYPFVFDVACKAKMLETEAKLSQDLAMEKASSVILGPHLSRILGPLVQSYVIFEVSRSRLISDTLDHLAMHSPADLKRPLKVRFTGEEAIDDGGVLKEFFILIMRELLNPVYGMFKEYPESRMLWFNENNMESPSMFNMVGALCGLAIYNSIIIDLCFPTALFKKLLGEEPTLEDLKELDPVVAKSLQMLLDYEEADLEDAFCLTFEIAVDNYGAIERIPLIPSGGEVVVTQENKQQYVEMYLNFRFNKSCQSVFEAFKSGFFNVCSGYVIKMFQPSELHSMVVGSDDIDWQDLRKNTNYQGEYWDQHPVIKWFWEVLLNQCNLKQKKNFLRFLTGCDRVPIEGLPGIKITIQPNSSGDDFLPVAHTCYNILDLPKYSSMEILRTKFMQAIENTEGFGLV